MSGEKERIAQETAISDAALRSLARTLLPAIREYLASDEGRRDYTEWQRAHGKS